MAERMTVDELRAIVARDDAMRAHPCGGWESPIVVQADRTVLIGHLRRFANSNPYSFSPLGTSCRYCFNGSPQGLPVVHRADCIWATLEVLCSTPTTLLPEQSRHKETPAMKIEMNADEVREAVRKDMESQGMVVESVKTGKNGAVVVEGHRPKPPAPPNVGTETLQQGEQA